MKARRPTTTTTQIEDAYREMARRAQYRPAAPSDGYGNITVPIEDLDLDAEARAYAQLWNDEEDEQVFRLGCCDFTLRPAVIFAVEAVRLLNCGALGADYGRKLLVMALDAYDRCAP